MNSLRDLREFFQDHNVVVTEFTGYSMTADSASWGIVDENPIKNGIAILPDAWKEYAKKIKSTPVVS